MPFKLSQNRTFKVVNCFEFSNDISCACCGIRRFGFGIDLGGDVVWFLGIVLSGLWEVV